jgi:hypothetical protein
MGVPTSEVGYTSVTTGRGDHEIHKGHVVALGEEGSVLSDCMTFFILQVSTADQHCGSNITKYCHAARLVSPISKVSCRNTALILRKACFLPCKSCVTKVYSTLRLILLLLTTLLINNLE